MKLSLSKLERSGDLSVLVDLIRAYRRNAREYYAHHSKLKGEEGCVCRRCQEHERLERLWPQFVTEQ